MVPVKPAPTMPIVRGGLPVIYNASAVVMELDHRDAGANDKLDGQWFAATAAAFPAAA
jgi:hypothetical protein